MSQRRGGRGRLTAADWAEAALAVLREGGGLSAIAIEPLAARMGATKGSFYWHFANRGALIEAALARWEAQCAEKARGAPGGDGDPLTRLRELLRASADPVAGDPTELALYANAGHPQVAPVLHRVTARRLDLLTGLLRELGLSAEQARIRGLQAYSGCLGRAQLARAVPELLPQGEDEHRYGEALIASLLLGD